MRIARERSDHGAIGFTDEYDRPNFKRAHPSAWLGTAAQPAVAMPSSHSAGAAR